MLTFVKKTEREEAKADARDSSRPAGNTRKYMEFFFCLESSTCRSTCGTVVARTTRLHTSWFEGYWFSICILPIVGHASFRSCKPPRNREADPPTWCHAGTKFRIKKNETITLAKTKSRRQE